LKGNYELYEEQKEVNLKTMEKKLKVVDKKRKQLERFTQRFHAQPNRASAVRNKRKQIERLENIDLPQEQKSIGEFEFADVPASGYVVEHLKGVSKSYGEKKVYAGLDLEVIRGQKICLVGPNGAGKSTLLKMLAGVIQPDHGEIKLGHQVQQGYFSQSRLDVLNPTRNAFEEVSSAAPQGIQSVRVRSLLGLFNFHGDDVFKPVKVLSGGEKSRVILARLLINPPNFMLLDEPTTHLDLDGVKALTKAFQKYSGTVVFISHDLFFIREIADHIVEVRDGSIKNYPGGLSYYLDKKGLSSFSSAAGGRQAPAGKNKKPKQARENSTETSPSSSGNSEKPNLKELREQHKAAKKRISQIKNQIKSLEQEQKDLETESYAKSRHLSKQFDKGDAEMLKEYGRRLKEIQSRQREIESEIKKLKEERDRISH
ncbi:MAG: ATP-binding cassette domain-containing protein, partial [Candidatus Omnitrophica bacterium]|nr:ATP-binding cassette domain-containing protein [Candidatus Omnitrophota bacterium]